MTVRSLSKRDNKGIKAKVLKFPEQSCCCQARVGKKILVLFVLASREDFEAMGHFTLVMVVLLIGGIIFANRGVAKTNTKKKSIQDVPLYLRDEYALMPPKKSESGNSENLENSLEIEGESTAVQLDWDGNQQLGPLSCPWELLSWKTICDDDEWRQQFATIRSNLTSCLEFTKILLPEDPDDEEEKKKRGWALMFSDGKSNPYCRLSRNWLSCYKLLEKTTCIQPDPKPLEMKKSSSGLRDEIRAELPTYKNPEDWISMHRPYKIHCLLSKAAYGFNPFAMFGGMGF